MGFRLKTSKQTKEIFEELGSSTNLKPFALSKIAIAFSLREEEPIDFLEEKDGNGLELQRATVTADLDTIYKALMEIHCAHHLSDDEYYPTHTKKHIDRGAQLLLHNYKYSGGNLEKLIKQIFEKGDASL